jgi:CBS domain-containing protein
VARFMSRDIVYAAPQEDVDTLLSRMTDRRIRHLPVCKDDKLLGVVSIGDLVKAKIAAAVAEAEGLKAYIAQG